MRCVEFQQRWQDLLDQRRSPEVDELLCEHAEYCADCGELLRIQTLLFQEVERSRPARMVSKASRSRQLAKAALIAFSVACSLLVVMIPAWRHRTSGEHVGRGVAFTGRRTVPPVVWVGQSPSGAHRKAAHGSMSARPVQSDMARHGSTSIGMTAEQESLRRLMQDMAARLSDVPEEKLEPLDRIAGGFRPLANTLGVAWDALRRTIPVGRVPAVHDPQAVLGPPDATAISAA